MKRLLQFTGVLLLSAALTAGLSGCYTQIGVHADDRGYSDADDRYAQEYEEDSTYAEDEGYDGDWEYYRPNTYFDYYYPSFGFGLTGLYWRPWYYGPYGGSWYYGPWGGGLYGMGYEPGWWYPHVSLYPGSLSRPRVNRAFGTTRTFGTTRSFETTRGGSFGSGIAPTGRAYRPSGGSVNRPGATSSGKEGMRPSRSSETRSSTPSRRVAPGRYESAPRRDDRPERSAPVYLPPPPRRENGGGRESSGEGRSYTPPPSSSPSSGSAPDRGGSRGSESGGGRRESGNRR